MNEGTPGDKGVVTDYPILQDDEPHEASESILDSNFETGRSCEIGDISFAKCMHMVKARPMLGASHISQLLRGSKKARGYSWANHHAKFRGQSALAKVGLEAYSPNSAMEFTLTLNLG
ncbi:hypothetical protein VNO77_22974 [Canavalia gladiata]|uniref:Uncharacterized protein n=1 Tax=Canavalia gladiata TaxID=3824 RepID=A0AAN9QEZ1_CANGL